MSSHEVTDLPFLTAATLAIAGVVAVMALLAILVASVDYIARAMFSPQTRDSNAA